MSTSAAPMAGAIAMTQTTDIPTSQIARDWLDRKPYRQPFRGVTDWQNSLRSMFEVLEFRTSPPARYFAYHDRDMRTITTWTGDELATITHRGLPFRSNMGDQRQAFKARTIDGIVYNGVAFLDSGDYVRMRRAKTS